MKGEYTAIIEKAPEGGYWAVCPEVPGANGQGESIGEVKQSLREAIRLIMKDRLEVFSAGSRRISFRIPSKYHEKKSSGYSSD